MQNPNGILINAVDDSADITSGKLSTGQWVTASFMGYFSDTDAAGTLKIQYSNDPSRGVPDATFTPTNWADVPGTVATATVTSGGTVTVYLPVNFVGRWLRIFFDQSGGSGTCTVTYNGLFV